MLDPSTRDHIFKKDDVLKTLSKAAKALDNNEDENLSQNATFKENEIVKSY